MRIPKPNYNSFFHPVNSFLCRMLPFALPAKERLSATFPSEKCMFWQTRIAFYREYDTI